jgi:hypothetical protein
MEHTEERKPPITEIPASNFPHILPISTPEAKSLKSYKKGQPRKYGSNAERQAAYRKRKKEKDTIMKTNLSPMHLLTMSSLEDAFNEDKRQRLLTYPIIPNFDELINRKGTGSVKWDFVDTIFHGMIRIGSFV